MPTTHQRVKAKLCEIYDEMIAHDGFAGFTVEIRILRRGQKEVIVDCGKQYRFVVDVGSTAWETQRVETAATSLPGEGETA